MIGPCHHQLCIVIVVPYPPPLLFFFLQELLYIKPASLGLTRGVAYVTLCGLVALLEVPVLVVPRLYAKLNLPVRESIVPTRLGIVVHGTISRGICKLANSKQSCLGFTACSL